MRLDISSIFAVGFKVRSHKFFAEDETDYAVHRTKTLSHCTYAVQYECIFRRIPKWWKRDCVLHRIVQ
jgi:hypothetical protein